ncbi:MAG: PadR family transcriptional regulator [Candidatus Heimdallarchaeota archaeon]|nr:PadR family transcriptional regulator [Candidatus Heimdallarchaeota archaeon]
MADTLNKHSENMLIVPMIVDKSIPLTSAQSIFLMVLKGEGRPMSGKEIVDMVELKLGENSIPTPGAVYKILNHLEVKKKYIKETTTKMQKQEDGRIRYYTLTDLGNQMVANIYEHVKNIFSFMCYCCIDISNAQKIELLPPYPLK